MIQIYAPAEEAGRCYTMVCVHVAAFRSTSLFAYSGIRKSTGIGIQHTLSRIVTASTLCADYVCRSRAVTLCSPRLKKGRRKMEGSYWFSEGNHLRQLHLVSLVHPLLPTFCPGASSMYSRGLDGRLLFPASLTSRKGIHIKSALPARNNSHRGCYPFSAFGGTSVCPVRFWGGWRVM